MKKNIKQLWNQVKTDFFNINSSQGYKIILWEILNIAGILAIIFALSFLTKSIIGGMGDVSSIMSVSQETRQIINAKILLMFTLFIATILVILFWFSFTRLKAWAIAKKVKKPYLIKGLITNFFWYIFLGIVSIITFLPIKDNIIAEQGVFSLATKHYIVFVFIPIAVILFFMSIFKYHVFFQENKVWKTIKLSFIKIPTYLKQGWPMILIIAVIFLFTEPFQRLSNLLPTPFSEIISLIILLTFATWYKLYTSSYFKLNKKW